MKKETMLEIVLRTKMALSRRKETREDIMLMLQKMMNLPQRESDKKVMKNMCDLCSHGNYITLKQ